MALQVLFQHDLNPECSSSTVDEFVAARLRGQEDLIEFCRSLVQGVQRNRDELDQLIGEMADHWSVGRMAATDRNVLRLGSYELLYTQTPGRVVINEAVELARRFGAQQSGPFVNGLLDRILKEHTKET